MTYFWHGNLRLHHLSTAITAPTQLAKHLEVDLEAGRKVSFNEEYRKGGGGIK